MIQKSIMILLSVLCALVAAFIVAVIITATAEEMPEEKNKKHPLEGCVTYRDLLEVEHPYKVDDSYIGGCCGCPHEYGYDSIDARPCDEKYIGHGEWDPTCKKCWSRHVPKETLTRLMEGQ